MTGEVDNTIYSLIYIIIPDNIKGPAHTYLSGKQCSLLFLLLLLLYFLLLSQIINHVNQDYCQGIICKSKASQAYLYSTALVKY